WMNDVADVDLSYAGDSVDGRGELRIAELRLRPLDHRLVGFDRSLQLRDLRGLGLDQLRSRPPLIPQGCIAFEIGLRVGELGLIPAAVGGRLVELRLIGRGSITASRSPVCTLCPSVKLIFVICPWIWLRTITVLYAITVPTPCRYIGTSPLLTVPATTGTVGTAGGLAAAAALNGRRCVTTRAPTIAVT